MKRSQRTDGRPTGAVSPKPSWLLAAFFIVLLFPISVTIGGLRLSPIRAMLILSILPLTIMFFLGTLGKRTWVDGLILLHAIWMMVALMVVHGANHIAFAGITGVELVGGYLMGRAVIRRVGDFRHFVRIHMLALVVLSPFAFAELATGRLIIPSFFEPIFETTQRGQSAYGRLGLERVYSVFEHPILFGLFCSIVLANLLFSMRSWRVIAVPFSLAMTFMSLSSGPLLACGLQIFLIVWNWLTKGSWKTLVVVASIIFFTVDLMSNRTPFMIVAETLTFNSASAWARINIWTFGTQNVIENPLFGIGLNDWKRPNWLTASVDNFWLLVAMRYGLIGLGTILLATVLHFVFVIRASNLSVAEQEVRKGYSIALISTFFVLATVHIWGSMFVFVMFYFGAGAWFYTQPTTGENNFRDPEDSSFRPSVSYRRDPATFGPNASHPGKRVRQ